MTVLCHQRYPTATGEPLDQGACPRPADRRSLPMITRRQTLAAGLASTALAVPIASAAGRSPDPRLAALLAGPQRSPANVTRDPWRHPLASLAFWGLRPGMTVADIDPAGGYWTEIVAPYLAKTGGRYVAGMTDPSVSDAARRAHDAFAAKYADAAVFGTIEYAPFGRDVG